jgi:V8-like Glu-specific endopeptidase
METSICDGTDNRQLSGAPPNEPDGRIRPVGCTGFLIGERCFLTAGHCTTNPPNVHGSPFDPNMMQVVEFNVPLSDSNGSINFSDPDDQYPIQTASIQFESQACATDWAQFAAFENSNTGLTPLQAQGASYALASSAPPATGQLLRLRGYGTTTQTNAPNEWNQVLTFHNGPYHNLSGNLIQHRADTTGGNSGSAIFMFSTGTVIGVHACGGCTDGGGANNGTAIHHPNLQNALNNPLGGCAIDAHCPGAGNCCVANGSPGCDNAACCEMICAADPFCCNTNWDSLCASAANAQCPVCFECGHPASGDCCESNDTPYCNHEACCELVCADDSFCCNVEWDSLCASAANQECVDPCFECGHGPAGSCCEANGTPYCDDETCCEMICANDPFCCNTNWDSACASAADTQCTVCHECGHPATGDCCEAQTGSPYCDDEACCELICADDAFCCNTNWDGLCASAAFNQCLVCLDCGHPATGDCCEANGSPYCDNEACCDAVCAFDPYCCNGNWDALCVVGAQTVPDCDCAPLTSDCPADLNGDSVVDGSDLLILLAAWGPNPGHPADLNDDDVVDGSDLLILLAAWGPCPGACDTPFVCDGSPVPWCDEEETCGCLADFDGVTHCAENWTCTGISCEDGNCPAGHICIVDSCCGETTCMPVAALCLEEEEPTCDEGFVFGGDITWCNQPEECVCFSTFGDRIECLDATVSCGQVCPDGTCPPGQICVVDTCCNGGAPTCVEANFCEFLDEQECDDPFTCGDVFPDGHCEEDCLCVQMFDGDSICKESATCTGITCPDGDCPDGYVCVLDTCCGATHCSPVDTFGCPEALAAGAGVDMVELEGVMTESGAPAMVPRATPPQTPRPTAPDPSPGQTPLGDQKPFLSPREMNGTAVTPTSQPKIDGRNSGLGVER